MKCYKTKAQSRIKNNEKISRGRIDKVIVASMRNQILPGPWQEDSELLKRAVEVGGEGLV